MPCSPRAALCLFTRLSAVPPLTALLLIGCSGTPDSAASGGTSSAGGIGGAVATSGGATANSGAGGAAQAGRTSGGSAGLNGAGGRANPGAGGMEVGGTSNSGAAAGFATDGGTAGRGAGEGGRSSGGSSVGGGGIPAQGGTSTAGSASGGATSGGSGGSAQTGLPPGVTAMFPGPGASGTCPDPALRITFSGAPTLGKSGKIQVFEAAGSAVASVDLSATNVSDTIGGTTFSRPLPAYVDGNTAVIYLKNKALSYGHTYYITVDSGAIRPPGGGSFSLSGANAWRFSTAAAAPRDLTSLTVSADGADFCSVQGALDALPANNSAASLITVRKGSYHEIIHASSKSNVTLRGEDRKLTIISGVNNENLNGGTANRALVGFDRMNGLVVENMTIHNLTPQGGSQAEALRMQNCDKCVVRNADILSLQDTLLWSGRVYAENSYIEGNVDYIWGTGIAYFNKCEIRTVGRTGVLVQARNAADAFGYVFVDCKLTADAAASNNMLARIDVSAYPGSHVAYINCQMTNIGAAGWTITGGTAGSSLRFWEYQSVDANGNAIDTSRRVAGSTRISADQAAKMRDVTQVLGGWQPSAQ